MSKITKGALVYYVKIDNSEYKLVDNGEDFEALGLFKNPELKWTRIEFGSVVNTGKKISDVKFAEKRERGDLFSLHGHFTFRATFSNSGCPIPANTVVDRYPFAFADKDGNVLELKPPKGILYRALVDKKDLNIWGEGFLPIPKDSRSKAGRKKKKYGYTHFYSMHPEDIAWWNYDIPNGLNINNGDRLMDKNFLIVIQKIRS